jgi:predicted DNA-binding protein
MSYTDVGQDMPFSLRLDPDTERRIRQLAAATGRSRSFVVREAVARYAAEAERTRDAVVTALDRLRPYSGALDSGGAQYSTDTHAKYHAALREVQDVRRDRRRRRTHRAAR